MARPRSPNYPAISLGKAIEAVRPVLKRENRNKMSTLVLAKHLGSNALNGRVLARIGALRAYGLIEGPGDGLRISDDAVDLLSAPEDSTARQSALERCAFRPSIFKKLREDSPDLLTPPSIENLRFGLIKEGFTEGAAGRAAKSYLATIGLVTGNASLYDSAEEDEETGETTMQSHTPDPAHPKRQSPPIMQPPPTPPKPGMQRADLPLTEGVARFEFPADMSAESYDGLAEWVQLILRLAKRSIKS